MRSDLTRRCSPAGWCWWASQPGEGQAAAPRQRWTRAEMGDIFFLPSPFYPLPLPPAFATITRSVWSIKSFACWGVLVLRHVEWTFSTRLCDRGPWRPQKTSVMLCGKRDGGGVGGDRDEGGLLQDVLVLTRLIWCVAVRQDRIFYTRSIRRPASTSTYRLPFMCVLSPWAGAAVWYDRLTDCMQMMRDGCCCCCCCSSLTYSRARTHRRVGALC